MALFDGFKNAEFECIIDIVNAAIKNHKITVSEIKRACRNYGVSYTHVIRRLLSEDLNGDVFITNPDGSYSISEQIAEIPIIPSKKELEWLKYAVMDRRARWFFESKMLKKISNILDTVTPSLSKEVIEICAPSSKEEQKHICDNAVIRNLCSAISQKLMVKYTYRTNNNPEIKEAEVFPYRLEYSVYDGRLWLLLYDINEKRPIKCRVENIDNVVLTKSTEMSDIDMENIIVSKGSPLELKLEVTNKYNALERCFYLFSPYDKTSEYDDETGVYKLSMNYFMFDEEEIVTNILYLGKFVKIIEPSNLRSKLINRIRKALVLYE